MPPPDPAQRQLYWWEDDEAIDRLSQHERNAVLRMMREGTSPKTWQSKSERKAFVQKAKKEPVHHPIEVRPLGPDAPRPRVKKERKWKQNTKLGKWLAQHNNG